MTQIFAIVYPIKLKFRQHLVRWICLHTLGDTQKEL
jgi:hypothetical protein